MSGTLQFSLTHLKTHSDFTELADVFNYKKRFHEKNVIKVKRLKTNSVNYGDVFSLFIMSTASRLIA
ncbi:hypothetical protein SporoP37_13480 [Sporosarcina sp. P37]|nr:hypothetical protein SporoP37_13480 [Sporosarcina sp. P37]PID16244.1 hypothetical protein CSV62_15880 [Sporosarcina sp. P35]